MKTIPKLLAGAMGAAALTIALPAFSGVPGQGYDAFRSGDIYSGVGEGIPESGSGYVGTSSSAGLTGQGYDAFGSGDINSGVGEAIPDPSSGYVGASLQEAPSHGFDLFRSGDPSL
jgi:hypothetical protein